MKKKKKIGPPKLITSHSKLRVDPKNPRIKIVTWPICVLYYIIGVWVQLITNCSKLKVGTKKFFEKRS